MIGPKDFLAMVIAAWEGGYQSYADDLGNWVTKPDGSRIKIGTMRGVTPVALAMHRGLRPWELSEQDMKDVTLGEAVDIGYTHYYMEPGFDGFVWGGAAASLTDFGWGSGPGQAALSMQRLLHVGADGRVGDITKKAFNDWHQNIGATSALHAVHDMRKGFYEYLAQINPANNARFLNGWINRDDWVSGIDPDHNGTWG